ncbi:MAG: hypothetical protein KA116_03945 [Proteobacteria bacterium]|nr:hypothetical protein [Pseudomonadota bacterium]
MLRPKLQVANYVESQGLRTPKRFSNLDEALNSGIPFIVRSESPYEYDGPSGVAQSFVFSANDIDWALKSSDGIFSNSAMMTPPKILALYFKDQNQSRFESSLLKFSEVQRKEFAKLSKISIKKFLQSFTFSYWEYLPGINISIVRDSSIENRYHIFSSSFNYYNYSVVDSGMILFEGPLYDQLIPPQHFNVREIGSIQKLIEFYEGVRSLPAFNKDNAAIVELQAIAPGDFVFLQYHRTRDLNEANFKIDERSLIAKGYSKIPFIRGHTGSHGKHLNIYVLEDPFFLFKKLGTYKCSYEKSVNFVYRELMSRKMDVCFMDNDFERAAQASHTISHLNRSEIFNPNLCVFLPLCEILSSSRNQNFLGQFQIYRMHLISDGRVAYYLLED